MEILIDKPSYRFRIIGAKYKDGYKKFADQISRNIHEKFGSDLKLSIVIQSTKESAARHKVEIQCEKLGETLKVEKSGRNVINAMRRASRVLEKQAAKKDVFAIKHKYNLPHLEWLAS